MQKRFIINADDFGINKKVTKEIERFIEEGVITSTTIMANGACLEEVARFARSHQEASFGVHLCLSEFESITKSPVLKKYGITDNNGNFVRKQIFKIKHFDKELLQAIKDELVAQINILKSYNIPLSHCDSHHHVHAIFGLEKIFEEVLKEEGFNKIRIARKESGYNLIRHPLRSIKRLYMIRYYKKKFLTTDSFCSYAEYLHNPSLYKGNIIELMCHPGHEEIAFVKESQLVQNKVALQNLEIKLISYLDI